MSLVSVIIPCYNAGEFIQEAIDSVIAQTYTNWEIIIVNDGSTDKKTLEKLQELEAQNFTVLHKTNGGLASARNYGITHSHGELILPLDADDRIALTYIEKAVPLFENNPKLGIVYCRAEKFGTENGEWDLPEFKEEKMVLGNLIFCTAFFKKSDWDLAQGYPEFIIHALEDYAFWLRILRLKRDVYKIDEILFYYRTKEQSMTTSFKKNIEHQIITQALIFQDNADFFAKHAEYYFRHMHYNTALIKEPKLAKLYLRLKPFISKYYYIKEKLQKLKPS